MRMYLCQTDGEMKIKNQSLLGQRKGGYDLKFLK